MPNRKHVSRRQPAKSKKRKGDGSMSSSPFEIRRTKWKTIITWSKARPQKESVKYGRTKSRN